MFCERYRRCMEMETVSVPSFVKTRHFASAGVPHIPTRFTRSFQYKCYRRG